MKLKPAEGRAVRDPVKRTLLPEDGADVTLDAFWRRRLRDGDVVEVTTDTATAETTSTATSKAKTSTAATGDAGASADAATTGATS